MFRFYSPSIGNNFRRMRRRNHSAFWKEMARSMWSSPRVLQVIPPVKPVLKGKSSSMAWICPIIIQITMASSQLPYVWVCIIVSTCVGIHAILPSSISAMEVFEREGHLVQAVLPPSVSGHHNLSDLLLAGKIIEVEDDNPHSLGELILRLATEQDAAVISNNNFASYFYRYRDVVDGRVCGYVWFENSLYIVTDPYGRYRPKLDSILNKWSFVAGIDILLITTDCHLHPEVELCSLCPVTPLLLQTLHLPRTNYHPRL